MNVILFKHSFNFNFYYSANEKTSFFMLLEKKVWPSWLNITSNICFSLKKNIFTKFIKLTRKSRNSKIHSKNEKLLNSVIFNFNILS